MRLLNEHLYPGLYFSAVLYKFTAHSVSPGNPMLTAPQIDSAMEELEALAPLLSAETSGEPGPLPPRARAVKEALMTTRVLVEKLRIVRNYCSSNRGPHIRCTDCEDI